jgi:hypothetical protein
VFAFLLCLLEKFTLFNDIFLVAILIYVKYRQTKEILSIYNFSDLYKLNSFFVCGIHGCCWSNYSGQLSRNKCFYFSFYWGPNCLWMRCCLSMLTGFCKDKSIFFTYTYFCRVFFLIKYEWCLEMYKSCRLKLQWPCSLQ